MNLASLIPSLLAVLHLALVLGVSLRVIMRRPQTGVALAWLFIVAAFPYAGAALYFMLGEKRISQLRGRRISERKAHYQKLLQHVSAEELTKVNWESQPQEARGMDALGAQLVGFPTVTGSRFRLFANTEKTMDGIVADIDNACHSVLMQFYIWNEGGKADNVLDALIRAAQRGVACRVLIDSLGARSWWKGKQPDQLKAAGVQVCEALPVGVIRSLIARTDLRNHRKIVVIDGAVAWTGSMNMVDPKFFKQDAGVGEWIDAMLRIEGTAVAPLALTMIGDWMLENDEALERLLDNSGLKHLRPAGRCDIQVIPTGPGETDDGLLQMLLAAINSAREELILTTPYFVPDESLLRAVRGAAARGVRVHLVVPEKVDSLPTRFASRSYYTDLLEVGVHVHLYRGGLLHTKSLTADSRITMFGTVNLDMRSLWINYEVALFAYGDSVGKPIRDLQQSYIGDSVRLDPATWDSRSLLQKTLENTFRLASPIL